VPARLPPGVLEQTVKGLERLGDGGDRPADHGSFSAVGCAAGDPPQGVNEARRGWAVRGDDGTGHRRGADDEVVDEVGQLPGQRLIGGQSQDRFDLTRQPGACCLPALVVGGVACIPDVVVEVGE
jgi:hypothetical protein